MLLIKKKVLQADLEQNVSLCLHNSFYRNREQKLNVDLMPCCKPRLLEQESWGRARNSVDMLLKVLDDIEAGEQEQATMKVRDEDETRDERERKNLNVVVRYKLYHQLHLIIGNFCFAVIWLNQASKILKLLLKFWITLKSLVEIIFIYSILLDWYSLGLAFSWIGTV